jgi:hypothetical protein
MNPAAAVWTRITITDLTNHFQIHNIVAEPKVKKERKKNTVTILHAPAKDENQ